MVREEVGRRNVECGEYVVKNVPTERQKNRMSGRSCTGEEMTRVVEE